MSALRPNSNKAHDLGSSSVKWGTLHVGDVQTETMTTSGNVEIQGNLTVTGTQTSLQVSTVEAEDPLIKLARGNTGDAIDIGFYGLSNDGSDKYHGLARDADDGKFYLFKDLATEPTTTIGTLSAGNKAVIVATIEGDITGDVTGNADTASALETARTLSISGDAAGSVSFDGSANADIAITIGSNAVENSMILNSTITVAGDSGSQAIDLGDTLTIQGTANEIVTSQSGDVLTIALPDAVSGLTSVSATSLVGALTGNASTATALQTARTLSISGDASGSASFDGSANTDIAITIGEGAVENAMLDNSTIGITVDGAGGESIALGESIDFNGTASQISIAYSAAENDLTFSLPSTINVDTSGNAASATALQTSRDFSIGAGPVRASAVSFDATGNVSLTSSIADDQITNAMLANDKLVIQVDGVDYDRALGSTLKFAKGGDLSLSYSAVDNEVTYSLDAIISSDTSGNAATATALETARDFSITGSEIQASAVSFDATGNVALSAAIQAGSVANSKLANSSTSFSDGSTSTAVALGSQLTIQGTADEVDVVNSAGVFTIGLPDTIQNDTSGNAATATALETARTIAIGSGPVQAAGVSFDGSGNISLTSSISGGAILNTYLQYDGFDLQVGGVSQEDINLGDSLNFAAGSNATVGYNSSTNTLTFNTATSLSGVDTDGNAGTATALETSRDFSITGSEITASAVGFDGTGNVALSAAITTGAIANSKLANSSITVSDTSNSEAIALGQTLYFGGTSNEVDVSYNASINKFTFGLPDSVNVQTSLDVGSGLTVGGNATITGNISAAGLTATGANITFADNLIELGVNNTDLEDIGFYGQRGDGIGGSNGFAGIAFDESNSEFIAFTSTVEPSSTVGTHTKADLHIADLTTSQVDCAGAVIGQIQLEGSSPGTSSDSGTVGQIRFDSSYIYICTATDTWKRVALSTF